jgi:hypothetical protein
MPRPFLAIFWGGLFCGILDITSAIVAWNIQRGVKPIRILQSVAAGALGRAAFDGGLRTALLGLAFHFLIAFAAAAVFYLASRYVSFLTQHPVISGFIYGELVYLFMNFVVIPLSATRRGPFTWATIVTGPGGHLFFVGLPIALAVRYFSHAGQELPVRVTHQIA